MDTFRSPSIGEYDEQRTVKVTNAAKRVNSILGYPALDEEFESVLLAIPESDFQALTIEHPGWTVPAGAFYQNYHEALLIFCARCSVYLRMMGKPLNEQLAGYI